jgi:acylpyruvate hydrolase
VKLATIRLGDRTTAVRVEGDSLVDLGLPDVGAVLASAGGLEAAAAADGQRYAGADAEFAPLVPRPTKVVCVGLNYQKHIKEMGRDLPEYPTLFCKFADTLIGALDDVRRPVETEQLDWEAELAVVVGRQVRRADETEAEAAIAGFTVLNDVTCRDWQFRTREWLQGKNWDSTTPLGPFLVTTDEVGGPRPAGRSWCMPSTSTPVSDSRTCLRSSSPNCATTSSASAAATPSPPSRAATPTSPPTWRAARTPV